MSARSSSAAMVRLLLYAAVAAMIAFAFAPLADARTRADFNGDGRSDLAIGAPDESLGNDSETLAEGAVHILYGASRRLGLARDRYLTEDTPGMKGEGPTNLARFGSKLTTGDFDGDGYHDLVIEAPWGGPSAAGAVHILYGARWGLTLKGDQYLTENSPGIKGGPAEFEDAFGWGLAAGDFNLDGRDDLAMGAPDKDVFSDEAWDGAVHVLYGGPRHLRVRRDQYLTAKNLGFAAHIAFDANFGAALAAGDLNGDRRADLVIGSPGEEVGRDHNAGAVRILLGGANRLRRANVRTFTEDSKRMAGPGAESSDDFGRSLAIGRFNGGRHNDLAIGAPDAQRNFETREQGAVHVLYGRLRGPSLRGDQYLSSQTPGIKRRSSAFGSALASGDLDGDGYHELAIGTPYGKNGGAVHVLYGARRHLKPRSDQLLRQNMPGMTDDGTDRDANFGFALGSGDFDGDRRADLAIGEPQPAYGYGYYDECNAALGGGGVHVLYGARGHLSLKGDQFLTQDTPGIAGDGSERCDEFGMALSGGAR